MIYVQNVETAHCKNAAVVRPSQQTEPVDDGDKILFSRYIQGNIILIGESSGTHMVTTVLHIDELSRYIFLKQLRCLEHNKKFSLNDSNNPDMSSILYRNNNTNCD